MTAFIENYYSLLEEKRKGISDSDFRFYNLGHLPLVINKTNELSTTCSNCRKHIKELEQLTVMLPECLDDPLERKKFDAMKNSVEMHLKKEHNIQFANYYYARYAVIGGGIGVLAGIILNFLIYRKIGLELPGVFCVVGLLTGQILGKYKDRKSKVQKRMI